MPLPNDKSAPRWDGDYRTLTQFVLDYERVADAAGYSAYEAIKAFINYIPEYLRGDVQNYKEFNPPKDPKNPTAAPTGDWKAFTDRLYKDFPRALKIEGFTRPEFWEFSAKNFRRSLRTEDELETFARELRRQTTLLIRDGNLSAGDAGAVFEEILYNNHGEPFRAELHRNLGRKHTYTIDEIFNVAREFVKYDKKNRFFSPELASLVGNRDGGAATAAHVSAAPSGGYPSELAAALARLAPAHEPVATTMTAQASFVSAPAPVQAPVDVMQQLIQSMQALSATLAAGQQGNSAPQGTPRGNRMGQRGGGGWDQNGDIRCFYCGGQHIQPNCEVLKSDLARGRCKHNQNGWVVFPNGDRIIQTPEMTSAQRVDHFNKVYPEFEQKASANGSAKAMLVEATEAEHTPAFKVPTFSDSAAEEAWHEMAKRQVFAFEQKKQEIGGAPRREGLRSRSKSGERKPNEAKKDAPAEAATKPGSDGESERRVRFEEQRKREESATAARQRFPSATIEEVEDDDAPAKHKSTLPVQPERPQYKVQSPLEHDGLGKIIGQRILDSQVVLTVEELIALCPSVRRYWRDASATRRVGVHLLEGGNDADEDKAQVFRYRVLPEGDASRDQIAAARILPLRYLDCRIGNIVAEGVVDGGAQLVIVSKRLWTAIGKPIDPSHVMNLEAANNTNSRTLGLLANLEVEIGGVKLLLQGHVVEEAPFDLLLGRPFFAIGCTVEETRAQGESYITIHDPNSELAVKIPTKERTYGPPAPLASAQGF